MLESFLSNIQLSALITSEPPNTLENLIYFDENYSTLFLRLEKFFLSFWAILSLLGIFFVGEVWPSISSPDLSITGDVFASEHFINFAIAWYRSKSNAMYHFNAHLHLVLVIFT